MNRSRRFLHNLLFFNLKNTKLNYIMLLSHQISNYIIKSNCLHNLKTDLYSFGKDKSEISTTRAI